MKRKAKPKKNKKINYPDTHASPRRRTPKSTSGVADEVKAWRKKNNIPGAKSVWLKNSKRTTEVIFSTPEILLEEFLSYVKFCKDNPWLRNEAKVTKNKVIIVGVPIEKPVTLGGFLVFCGVGDKYWTNFKAEIAPRNPDFGGVIDYVTKSTREQNIEGAAVGTYNGNIISRLHGLAENVNSNITDQRQQVGDVFPSKLKVPDKKK